MILTDYGLSAMLRESVSEMPMGPRFLHKNDAMSMIFKEQIDKLRFQTIFEELNRKKEKACN